MVRKAMLASGILCLLWALGGQTAMAQFGQMTGNVIGEDGKPLAGATISIDREDIKGHYEVKTDKSGKFFHAGLPLGKFSVSVMRDGKKVFSVGNIQTRLSEPATVPIDLQQERMRVEAQASGVQVPQGQQQGTKLSGEQMAAIEKAAKEREEQLKKNQALRGKFDTAIEALKSKNYDEAITQFQAAAEVDPTQHVVFAQLGEAYSGKASVSKDAAERKQNYDKSVEAYKKALDLKPDDPSYHNNFALALANEGRVDEAQAELVKAAQLDAPNAKNYYFNLGAVFQNRGNMKEAAEAFRKATEADANFAEGYYYLGNALSNLATMEGGKAVWAPGTKEAMEKYLQLAPNGPHAAEAKSLVDTITGGVTTQIGTPQQQQPRRR